MPNFDYEDNLFREAGSSPARIFSLMNNVVGSSDVPIIDLPSYDNSFNLELISALLNPQPPPELEPNSFPSLPAASMAPIHPMDQPNPMICNPTFTSYPQNSVVSQLPSDPLGLPGYIGMDPSAMQHKSFMDANGGIGGKLYAQGMRMPTCVANDGMGIHANVGMPVRPMEAAKACNLGGIYSYEAMPRLYSPTNLQELGDNQHASPMCNTSTAPLQMPSDILTMDYSNYKVNRISAEERREQLDRFHRKKKKRNYSKQIKECLSNSLEDKMPNFDYEDNLFREAGSSPARIFSLMNNVVGSSDVPIIDLPSYDNSFNLELISALLNPQPPPELEPNSFPSLPAASMAPIHPMDQPNPMICNPTFTSYPQNSVVSQLPSDPLGLPGYIGMDPSAMQHKSFMDANGGIGGQLYAQGMRMPTCVANDGMGIHANVGMPVRPMEAAKACNLGGIYSYEAMPRLYSPTNLQELGDNQHASPMCNTSTAPLQMPSDILTMDYSNYKVNRISAEERREQLDRFHRKKKKRNYSKQIKYTCRKILADSRPRVRGRFAKIKEFSEECLSNSSEDKMPNFDYEDNLFREAGYSPARVFSLMNNVAGSSDVPITDLPSYDNSFNLELISALLNPQPPPEREPNSFPSLPAASMAPIHPMDQPNPMICNPTFTSYPQNSVVSQLPSDPLCLPGYIGMEPSAMQHRSFIDANGGIVGQLYAQGMRIPTCVANDGMGIHDNVGMPVRPMEAAKACNLGGIYSYEAMPRLYSPTNLQVLGDNQHARPMCNTSTAPLQMPSDILTMDYSNYKVNQISVEERREQLDRFHRKKKKRNYSKQIKYTCRKILADSRPRIRGRFAKIKEFSEVVPMPSFA
ncbi:hypothetical protein KFK09_020643 [Dendrobium nobile]|uniref:CCT domain-containing protein n=1 Tax=Dendrobium nobile TaxID=94219 RepID=A0A8T3ALV4_DENNO|nr:hypothetical protein KFK09_020643 [Dendrobium nobile]